MHGFVFQLNLILQSERGQSAGNSLHYRTLILIIENAHDMLYHSLSKSEFTFIPYLPTHLIHRIGMSLMVIQFIKPDQVSSRGI